MASTVYETESCVDERVNPWIGVCMKKIRKSTRDSFRTMGSLRSVVSQKPRISGGEFPCWCKLARQPVLEASKNACIWRWNSSFHLIKPSHESRNFQCEISLPRDGERWTCSLPFPMVLAMAWNTQLLYNFPAGTSKENEVVFPTNFCKFLSETVFLQDRFS